MDFCINQSNTHLGKTKTYNHFNRLFNKGVKVIGVGGAGINIVNTMINSGIRNVDFAVVDTDVQKLNISNASQKTAVGQNLTGGLSAGGKPDRGEQAVVENVGVIRELISGIDIVFIVAGMSGGTGTGTAHVIARIAHEKKVLVMAAVMMPFEFEGSVRKEFAKNGIEKLRKNTDSLTIIRNEQIKIVNREKTLGFIQAINFANTIPCQIGQVLSELAVDSKRKKIINYMIRNAGNTFFAVGTGIGENRINDAVQNAVSNAMLETNGVAGARKILINIRLSGSLSDEEQNKIISLVKQYADPQVHIRFIISVSNNMYNPLTVAVIASGFRK